MFASRLPRRLEPNALSRALAQARHSGARLIDLTVSNPTEVGLDYPPELFASLGDPRAARYRPAPLGDPEAREAVAAWYRTLGIDADASRLMLTASTSEAYSVLFKLLCDPGDEVIVPQPSYPLFGLLTGLDGVSIGAYRLEYHGVWSIDRASLEAARTDRSRAVLVVSPNNPTGSMLRQRDRDWLRRFCDRHGLVIIADEVFAEYPLQPAADACGAGGPDTPVLTFVLGGLSKSVALPQMKLAWMRIDGPRDEVAAALERLDVIGDTYLSVSTPVQAAARDLLRRGAAVREAVLARLGGNLAWLRAAVARRPEVTLLEPEGGWSAVLRVPAVASEESIVLRLLGEQQVVVHPGFFFDFATEAYLVLSLLPRPEDFSSGVDRLVSVVGGGAAS